VTLVYEVRNFVVGPGQGLQVKIPLTVRVEPEGWTPTEPFQPFDIGPQRAFGSEPPGAQNSL
jgi:hypothetical protein